MGGDYAPQAVVSGAVLAAGLIAPQSKIVLFGDRPSIESTSGFSIWPKN